eukprot:Nk52_evm1s2017 gene=Nk52_evmTU1s2017
MTVNEINKDVKKKRPIRIKVISLGDACVGKSCIIKRYCEKRFVSKYIPTIGIDYGVSKVRVDDQDMKVNFFDMAGHPLFVDVRTEFFKDTQGVVLVYDVNSKDSFLNLEDWLAELRDELGVGTMDNMIVAVCANKTDIRRRAVTENEGKYWADSRGFLYFETSANTNENINDMFNALFSDIISSIKNGKKPAHKSEFSYSQEQLDAVRRVERSRDDYERLAVSRGASSDDISKSYRKWALLLHPDRNSAPGSEEAFKAVVAAKNALLKGR